MRALGQSGKLRAAVERSEMTFSRCTHTETRFVVLPVHMCCIQAPETFGLSKSITSSFPVWGRLHCVRLIQGIQSVPPRWRRSSTTCLTTWRLKSRSTNADDTGDDACTSQFRQPRCEYPRPRSCAVRPQTLACFWDM